MFDVYGLVSELTEKRLYGALALFPQAEGVVLDSSRAFSGRVQDRLFVGTQEITLHSQLYNITHLRDGELELRPADFAIRYLRPAILAVAEQYSKSVNGVSVIATRAAKLPATGVYGGGYIDVNGVALRWFVDYDQTTLSDRLLVDVYVGTYSEDTVNA